jgi:hypothetical protein
LVLRPLTAYPGETRTEGRGRAACCLVSMEGAGRCQVELFKPGSWVPPSTAGTGTRRPVPQGDFARLSLGGTCGDRDETAVVKLSGALRCSICPDVDGGTCVSRGECTKSGSWVPPRPPPDGTGTRGPVPQGNFTRLSLSGTCGDREEAGVVELSEALRCCICCEVEGGTWVSSGERTKLGSRVPPRPPPDGTGTRSPVPQGNFTRLSLGGTCGVRDETSAVEPSVALRCCI